MSYIKIGGTQYPTCPEHCSTLVDPKFVAELTKHTLAWTPQGYCSITIHHQDGRISREQLHNYLYIQNYGKPLPDGMLLHHVNDNKWDNRLENLELTSRAHNSAAVDKKHGKSTSSFKGVSYNSKANKWNGQIVFEGQNTFLGHFEDEIEAARAYDFAFIAIYKSANGSNNLLAETDINNILENREQYLPKPKRHDRELPKYISYKGSKFRVLVEKQDLKYRGIFSSLQEAVNCRDKILQKYEEDKKIKLHENPILRNNEGVAIVPVKLFKSDDVVYTLVSDEDYYDVVQHKWYLNRGGYPWSRLGSEMQCFLVKNNDPTKVVDHINCDKMDNRRENLRIVSRSFNNRNKRKREGTSSKYKGVQFYSQTNKWRARIKINNHEKHLGYFHTEEEARIRYQEEYDKLEKLEEST